MRENEREFDVEVVVGLSAGDIRLSLATATAIRKKRRFATLIS